MPSKNETQLRLTLRGTARLLDRQRTVPLRRKALALLYRLALEGAAPREHLADLLWGHLSATNNLRVELSYLRQALAPLGLKGFESRLDPLELPHGITLTPAATGTATEGFLVGLDDVSPGFQEWLELQRAQLQRGMPHEVPALIRQLAATIQAPFLLLITPQLGDSARETARELALALGTPFYEGAGQEAGVHYLAPPHAAEVAAAIEANKRGIFVLEKTTASFTSQTVLRLRAHYPAERIRYLQLPAHTWEQARGESLAVLPFEQAAKDFLASDGNPIYLRELAALRRQHVELVALPFPRRIAAHVQLGMSHLSAAALLALERCSVHSKVLPDGLLQAFGVHGSTEELERSGWLRFDASWDGWLYRNNLTREVLYRMLQPGQKRDYHLQAAGYFREQGQLLPAFHHQQLSAMTQADRLDPAEAVQAQLSGWQLAAATSSANGLAPLPAAASAAFSIGSELMLLPEDVNGAVDDGSHGVIHRHSFTRGAWKRSWELPDEACLLRLRGRSHYQNALGIGLHGDAFPLELSFTKLPMRVIFADIPHVGLARHDELLLPLHGKFDYWFFLPAGGELVLRSKAESGLIEFSINAFRCLPAGSEGRVVQAFLFEDAPQLQLHKPVGGSLDSGVAGR